MRALRAVLAAGLAAVLLAPAVGGPVGATPSQDPGPAGPPTLTLLKQDLEVAPDGDFRVFLRITDPPAGGDLAVQIFERIDDLASYAASTGPSPADLLDTFDPIPLPAPSATGRTDAEFTISLYERGGARPPGAFAYGKLDQPGVYPVLIRLRSADDDVVTSIVTYLVRKPNEGEPVTSARVALLTTVHQDAEVAQTGLGDEPPAGEDEDEDGDGDGDVTTTVPATGDEPTTSVEWQQDLDDVLAAFGERPELPATFTVTPETADRLAADPDAADTLTALQAEVGRPTREVTAAPYVDIDPASLVANGLSSEVLRQADLGTRSLRSTLALPDPEVDPAGWSGHGTWVVDHPVDDPTLDLLADLGVDHLVLPTDATVAGTPYTRLPLPGADRAVEALSDTPAAFETDAPDDPVLAGYQLLGRLAAFGSINPRGTASVLRIDPETVDPQQLATVLDGLATPGSFLRATTLAGAFADGPVAPAPAVLTAPDTGGLGAYPALVTETYDLLGSYGSMLIDRGDLVQAFERPMAVTAAADADLVVRRRALRRIQDELRARLGAVSTPDRDRVTLGARDARFPLPITSSLSEPVKVVITFEASDRLAFPEQTIEATLTDERTVVQIPVQTRATGDTPLRITVRTPDQRVILAESRYTVRSTAVSGVGLLLTIGAGGFLALWWGRHIVRTRRAGRHRRTGPERPGPTDAPDGLGPPPDDADDDLFVDVTTDRDAGSNPG